MAFWEIVSAHKLKVFDQLNTAAAGLLVKPGGGWRPLSVVYDVEGARNAFRRTFRDPITVSERRRQRDLETSFQRNVLDADLGENAPVFAKLVEVPTE